MGGPRSFDAVLLVGDGGRDFFPLVSKELPQPLLPVGNRPLLTYTLQMFEASGLHSILVVVAGVSVAAQVTNWIGEAFNGRLTVKVATVREDGGTADALREILDRLTGQDVLVVGGDVVSDVPLGSIAAAHRQQGAAATVLLYGRPPGGGPEGSSGSEKKKEKVKKDVIGVDSSGRRLVFCASSSDGSQQLRMRRSLLRDIGVLTLHTDLVVANVYAFNRQILQEALKTNLAISSIQRDLLPYLVNTQTTHPLARPTEDVSSDSTDLQQGTVPQHGSMSVGGHVALAERMSHTAENGHSGRQCVIQLAGPGRYCARVDSLTSYADINRDMAGDALHLTGFQLSASNNVIHESVELGSKTAVGPQCMVGEGSRMGDKCSVKKSLVGRHCRIGSNVKIINSVVMDHVSIADGCVVQNSIVGSNGRLNEHSTLKDCQVAAGYTVAAGVEHQREALAKKDK